MNFEGEDEYPEGYEEYPTPRHARLAQQMDEAHMAKHETDCVGCSPYKEYLVPCLCEHHFKEWCEDQKSFERRFYHD